VQAVLLAVDLGKHDESNVLVVAVLRGFRSGCRMQSWQPP
jgi:hypothetical protein